MSQPPSASHLRRFRGYDYSRGASLFITISTEPRRALFGRVEDAKVLLSPLGEAAASFLARIFSLYPGFTLRSHVVMPDHLHFTMSIAPGVEGALRRLGLAIRGFKHRVEEAARLLAPPDTAPSCREMNTSRGLWQRGYHDHVLTSRAFIEAVERYIAMNPLKWEMQRNGERLLRVREPLVSARLDPGEYWRGIGDPDLLDPSRPLASVRISRACGMVEISAAVERLKAALDKGYTLVSGFISPGERALRDIVLARKDARFIVVLPEVMPYGYKPDSRYIEPIREGRCLVMAHGMEGVDFGRGACLDLNARIATMAKAGLGYATYWRPGAKRFV